MAEHVFQWRNMMEFFLIKHFRRCLPLLLKYDAVGASCPQETAGFTPFRLRALAVASCTSRQQVTLPKRI